MDIYFALAVMSVVLWAGSFVFYIPAIYGRSILGKKIVPTEPSIATWLIFLAMDIVVLIGMYQKGAVNFQIVAALVGAALLVFIALFRGKPGITPTDVACVLLTGVGILLWVWFWEANWGIVIGSIAMVVGGIPTITSIWEKPWREDLIAWSLGLASCIFILPTIQSVSVEALSQPIAFFVIEFAIVAAIVIRRYQLQEARP